MATHRDDDFTIDRLTSAPTLGVVTAPPPPPATPRFAPGAIVAGRYRLVALLGRAAWARSTAPTTSRSTSRWR